MRISPTLIAALALVALAGCKKQADVENSTVPAVKAAPVAAAAGQSWTDTVARTSDGGFMMGNPKAPIKLVEYGSRSCPHCAKFAADSSASIRQYVASGKVSYEFRDFLVHPEDLGIVLLGECAGAGPFFPILEQTFAAQDDMINKKLEAASKDQAFLTRLQAASPTQQATIWAEYLGYIDFVKQRGVTEAQARACLADPHRTDAVGAVTSKAMNDLQVSGTPTFFLNGKKLETNEWSEVEAAMKAAGA